MVNFSDIKHNTNIYLYAGNVSDIAKKTGLFIGLSLDYSDNYHIKHDVTLPMNLLDNSVDIYQSEDVFEHIEYENLSNIFNEIYRVLKSDGLFRLSMPDYRCDLLYNRSFKDSNGNLYHDPGGGGSYDYINSKVINGGHVWFPKYESVFELFNQSKFNMEKVKFLHYYDTDNNPVINDIDYTKGYVHRTPDNDKRVQTPIRPMSIVLDAYK